MNIFQVNKPGIHYLDEQGNSVQTSTSLFYLLDNSYIEANVSLHLFQNACISLSHYMQDREAQEQTGIPRSFMMRSTFIPAHSYIYSLDTFREVLRVFSKMTDASPSFTTALAAFDTAFPKLRDIRNSAHHMEDRVRRLKSGGRTINVQPATTTAFVTNGNGIVLDNISGNRYGTTIEDGTFAELEISDSKMTELQKIYQTLVDACSWAGGFGPFPVII